jgi:tRNA pseudouridine65 synthase
MASGAAATRETTDDLEILLADERVCAIVKPAGIMVHPTNISTDRVFVTDLLDRQLERPVRAVHRLDRATSGVLLFALDREAAAALGRQFAEGRVRKRYRAVVRGWTAKAGTIDRPLQRNRGASQSATTHYRCLGRTELPVPVPPHATARYSLVEAMPETGRRHQIRRHFNGIAHPVIGDVNHGDRRHNRVFRARYGCHRLLLHAEELQFRHPDDDRPIVVRCAPTDDFAGVVDALDWAVTEAHAGESAACRSDPGRKDSFIEID